MQIKGIFANSKSNFLVAMSMKTLVFVLLVCGVCFAASFRGPNGDKITQSSSTRHAVNAKPRGGGEQACAVTQMNFYWGDSKHTFAKPRMSELYFYQNGTFEDVVYDYVGEWVTFGSNGDDILVYDYPGAKYLSPYNNGIGSMVSGHLCGYWEFANNKWNCAGSCST